MHNPQASTEELKETTHQLEIWIQGAADQISRDGPATLRAAIHAALFPGGARLRPRIVVAVARACGGSLGFDTGLAAAAIELFHAASLVHDDLPCFDDGQLRRGQPTVHRKYGVANAVLAGDALIVGGYDLLASCSNARTCSHLVRIACRALGANEGLIAGQALEADRDASVHRVHQYKTAALFEAAAAFGAVTQGRAPEPFCELGRAFGLAYQLLDDLADRQGNPTSMGKAIGQDDANDAPNAAMMEGVRATELRAISLIQDALASIPPIQDRGYLADFFEGIWNAALSRAGIANSLRLQPWPPRALGQAG